MYHPDSEQIIVLQPDLMITTVGASKKETVPQIERLGVAVYLLNSKVITVGCESFLHEIIIWASGDNLAKDAVLNDLTYSLEQGISAQPEVVALNSDASLFHN
jgi:ABC-type Fe3+-hydroxamate transport system substrate-binding protein